MRDEPVAALYNLRNGGLVMKRSMMSLAASLVLAASVHADVKLSGQFSDHMVLQRDLPVKVWGMADPGEGVSVAFGGASLKTAADDKGKWSVELPAMKASAEGRVLTIQGNNKLELADVLVGDVWVCSGQSNMEWNLKQSQDAEEHVAAASHPQIRLLNITAKRRSTTEPLLTTESKWAVCTPQSAADFSAVGYFFGKKLQEEIGVPIGLIGNAWGGMPAESYTPLEVLKSTEAGKAFVGRWEEEMARYPQAKAKHEADVAAWEKAAPGPDGKKPGRPWPPAGPDAPQGPGNLWNGMVTPIVGYGIKGAIWYQGESNAGRAYVYRDVMKTMIESWRKNWEQNDFPFLIVQLSSWQAKQTDPNKPGDWPELRDSQAWVSEHVPHTGLAVTTDVGDEKDIHPRDKLTVGLRLAAIALHDVYDQHVVAAGPELEKVETKGDHLVLHFKGDPKLELKNDGTRGFVIAGDDKQWHFATASIEDGKLVVKSDEVKEPKYVRYNWANFAEGRLYNDAGFPAAPFRSDDFPLMTKGKI
jgi:sialate O-acetylesterase